MMKFPVFFLSVLSIIAVESCNIINPSEKVPTYVHIDSFQFLNTANTGTTSHKITNVFAYLDYAPLGTFTLPADIPIIADKAASLMLIPGVQLSGMSSNIIGYPFYKADTSTLQPNPGQRVTVAPKTQYWGDSILRFTHEDFESGNSFTSLEGDSLKRTTDPQYVFEGAYGGVIFLKDSSFATNIMSVSFQSPTMGANKAEVFLEMDYKCTVPFVVGLQTTDGSSDVISYLYGFNPRTTWNKVYVGLEDFLTAYPNKSYRVVIRVAKNNAGTDYVAFDNFKVVSRK
ncbi:MAG TPA: hypothetical protein PL009_05650 [Flavipsychrobacter sp.]|nr:hypothetical protein [Flavipsychrobacter sp.]